jgi:hypothetical protein
MRDLVEAHRKVIIDAGLEHSKAISEANEKYFRRIQDSEASLIHQMQIRLDQFSGVESTIGAKEETFKNIDRDLKEIVDGENFYIKEDFQENA